VPERKETSQSSNPRMAVGVKFGKEQIVVALVDETGRVAIERRAETVTRTTRAAIAQLASLIIDLASAPERGAHRIGAIGLSVEGAVDPASGRVTIDGLKGWTRVPMASALEEAVNESGHDLRSPVGERRARAEMRASAVPSMIIIPRLTAMAAGEAWRGAAKGKQDVVYLSLGHGIEAGILAHGRPLLGSTGAAGAAGWLALDRVFRPEYEARGCLATEAGFQAFGRHAMEGWSGIADSLLGGLIKSDPTAVDSEMILRSARGGDDLAVKVVGDICRWIGRGAANLVSILDPDVIVLGGGLGLALKPYAEEIREEIRRWTSPEAGRKRLLAFAALGDQAAVIGAARLSLGSL
jgi:glucokinase